MSKKSKPTIIVKKGAGGLSPASSYDAEELDAAPVGTEFDIVSRTRRSNPQNRMYFGILSAMIGATSLGDQWPTAHKLHEAILTELGYVTREPRFGSPPVPIPDSTAFEAMDPEDFRLYFDQAMMLLSELTGVDPLTIARQGK